MKKCNNNNDERTCNNRALGSATYILKETREMGITFGVELTGIMHKHRAISLLF